MARRFWLGLVMTSGCLMPNPRWDGASGSGDGSDDGASGASGGDTQGNSGAASATGSATNASAGGTGNTDATDTATTGGESGSGITISGSGDHTCIAFEGQAWCWGAGTDGQIGDGANADRLAPVQVPNLTSVTMVSSGHLHTCAIASGEAWCWGAGSSGQLGQGVQDSSAVPVPVALPDGEVTSISAGLAFTCAVVSSKAYCWGTNGTGQLGTGAGTTTFAVPQVVSMFPSGVQMVDAGNDHACAIVDGAAYCWGHNDGGVGLGAGIGDGSSALPLPVVGMDTGVSQISIGGWGGCALRDGGAWCWGVGGNGELGDGNNSDSGVPVQPVGMETGVTWVRRDGGPVDGDAPCAVLDHQMYCWGNNAAGRLGDGTTETRSKPTLIDLPAPVETTGGGLEHNCAVLVDGRVFCSGRGDRGQLGDGTGVDSPSPVEVTPNWL